MRSRTVMAVALLLLLGACGWTADGGGWLAGKNGGKANLGFEIFCEEGEGTAAITYSDKSIKPAVSIKAVDVTGCDDVGTLEGTYRPSPKGDGGAFTITLVDTGETGPSKGDTVTISLTGGLHDGYSHSGVLQGGNVTVVDNTDVPDPCEVIPELCSSE